MRLHPLGEVLPAWRALTPARPAHRGGAAPYRPVSRYGHHCPDRQPGVVGPDTPAPGQVANDVEATATQRGDSGLRRHMPGSGSAVTYRNLDDAIIQFPGEEQIRARQRPGVADRIAEQFADNQHSIAD